MNWIESLIIILKEKTPKRTRGGPDSSGQAILESILLLIIISSIILGLLYQFNEAFTKFTKSYFGDYVACILASGELPSLGGQTYDSGSGPGSGNTCNAKFKKFDLESGRPLIVSGGSGGSGSGSGSGGSGGSGSNGNSSSASNAAAGADRAEGDRGVDPEGTGRSSGSESGRSAGRVPARPGSGFPDSGQSAGGDESSTRSGIPADENLADAGDGQGGSRRGLRSRRTGATAGETGEEYLGRYRFIRPSKDEEAKAETLAPAKVSAESDKKAKKGARVPTGKSDRQRMGLGDEDDAFVLNLPNMIRYLLIAGIAIAIGLFLGGQFMAIKKGAEKN